MRMPDQRTKRREFSLAISLVLSSAIQKPQEIDPKTQGAGAERRSSNHFLLLLSAPCPGSWFLPTNQKLSERLVHLVERICTKQELLKVRGIVNEIGGDFEVQRSQLSLVHLGQLSC